MQIGEMLPRKKNWNAVNQIVGRLSVHPELNAMKLGENRWCMKFMGSKIVLRNIALR